MPWQRTRQPIVLDARPVTPGPVDGAFTTVMQWDSYQSPAAPRAELAAQGWSIRDPLEVTLDPWTYQEYTRASKAEFSVAKHGYVLSRSGWFSERSACYMASGRPVVVQDSGFSTWLPTGAGVLAFATPDGAAAAIEAVSSDYDGHCRAARELAAAYFDSSAVLTELLERAAAMSSAAS